jgi:ParB/RepB/Spo0J family partition protein
MGGYPRRVTKSKRNRRIYAMNKQIEEVLAQVKPKCETISETREGILIKPKAKLEPLEVLALHQKLTAIGAEYTIRSNMYSIRPDILNREAKETLADIALSDLISGPDPRMERNDIALAELLADIRENGIRQRLEVRPSPFVDGKYEIVDGHNRKRVTEIIGLGTAPCSIKHLKDQEAYETAFTVNHQRNNLNSIEQGRWFKIMMEKFPVSYPTQEVLAKHVGVHQTKVSRLIKAYESNLELHYAARHNGKLKPTRGEANGEAPVPLEPLKEYVTRQIRQAPVEFQPQLYKEAQEFLYTAEQVKARSDKLQVDKLIESVPEKYREELRGIAEEERLNGRDAVERVNSLVTVIKSPDVSKEKKDEALQASAQKRQKKEDQRKKALVNVLSAGYPESRRLLEIIVKHFGRHKPHEMSRLVFMLAEQAIKALPPEKIEEIVRNIKKKVLP